MTSANATGRQIKNASPTIDENLSLLENIHIVPRSQVLSSTPDPLDAKDITSQVLTIAKECTEQLANLQDYHQMMVQQIAAELTQLEIIALRAIAQRGR